MINSAQQDFIRLQPEQELQAVAEQLQIADIKDAVKNHPIYVLDCEKLRNQYKKLSQALPNVKLFYAIKSLPHPEVIRCLRNLGAGFDIASSGEALLTQGNQIFGKSVIHTHPVKTDAEIVAALRAGCTTFVVDNILELEKFINYKQRVGILLRVAFRNADATVDLSKKFGCSPQQAEEIILHAQSIGIHVKGLSFHVGSQCKTADKHVEAIEFCSELISALNKKYNTQLHILNIGGGFPVNYLQPEQDDIENFCAPIREALNTLPKHLELFAEPGRYLSAPAVSVICSINGKSVRDKTTWYYLNDGVYGAFSGQIYDHARYPLTIYTDNKNDTPAILAGPTCDSIDVIADSIQLPDLNIGDIIIGEMMGAYTLATSTSFNSLPAGQLHIINQ